VPSVLGLLEAREKREKKVREEVARLREEAKRVLRTVGRGVARVPACSAGCRLFLRATGASGPRT
jgi:hypothetical protein